jgi:hypothetical protein
VRQIGTPTSILPVYESEKAENRRFITPSETGYNNLLTVFLFIIITSIFVLCFSRIT